MKKSIRCRIGRHKPVSVPIGQIKEVIEDDSGIHVTGQLVPGEGPVPSSVCERCGAVLTSIEIRL